jgi:hypothetical protein
MIISFILCCVLFLLAFLLSPKEKIFKKTSSYKCGFEPFGDAHLILNKKSMFNFYKVLDRNTVFRVPARSMNTSSKNNDLKILKIYYNGKIISIKITPEGEVNITKLAQIFGKRWRN